MSDQYNFNSAGFNLTELNKTISLANESISCGPSCMNQKQGESLGQKYLDAEMNQITAPQQFTTAKKDYIIYTQGEAAYNILNDTELQNQATSIVNSFQKNFNDSVKIITANIDSYQGILMNFDNIYDLYTKYKSDNDDLEKLLKTTYADTLTNDRKSYYEDEGNNRISTYYYFYLFIYVFLLVVFLLSIFLVNTNVKLTIRVFILFLLVLKPFVSYLIIDYFYNLYLKIKGYFTNSFYINP
jgi:hypothetical protein